MSRIAQLAVTGSLVSDSSDHRPAGADPIPGAGDPVPAADRGPSPAVGAAHASSPHHPDDAGPPPAPGAPGGSTSAAAAGPPASSGGSGRRLLAPVVALVAVGFLAVAAFGSGSSTDGTGSDLTAAAPDAVETDADAVDPTPEPDAGEHDAEEETQGPPESAASPSGDVTALAGRALPAQAVRAPEDPRAIGDPDAPVVMLEWADFLCPFCGIIALETEPELIARYVDTGVLRIEWRDLPLQGEGALLAAVASRAAAAQGGFWEMHEALFTAELRDNPQRATPTALIDLAGSIGLDQAAFAEALTDETLLTAAIEEAQIGRGLGMTGTPTFLVNGRPLVGAQPLEAFDEAIRTAAIEAGAEELLP